MTTLSWQPAKHSWGPPKDRPWVDGQSTFSECRICGALKRATRIKTNRLIDMSGACYYQTSTRLATKDAPDVWLPPAQVRCIHRGLRVLP